MEVTKIQEKQEEDKVEMQAKDETIAEIRDENREMLGQLNMKTEEIKTLIDRMESYKKHKEIEIAKVKIKQKQTEEELKVLIKEHEKQKREAGEKLRLLNDMFKQWNTWYT